MKREIRDKITFKCTNCGITVDGNDDELLIYESTQADAGQSKYDDIIRNARYDDTITLIDKKCTACNRDYMKHVIVSDDRISYYVCKCGQIN